MSAREYPVTLTLEEIKAVQSALEGVEVEYGLASSFYSTSKLRSGATVEEHREEARREHIAADEKGQALLEKIATLAATATELEPS